MEEVSSPHVVIENFMISDYKGKMNLMMVTKIEIDGEKNLQIYRDEKII